jgi:hypothetical protein
MFRAPRLANRLNKSSGDRIECRRSITGKVVAMILLPLASFVDNAPGLV